MEPCKCWAYKFPHRPGGGACLGGDYYCAACETYQPGVEERFISGRRGHIDNWEPDENLSICPGCGAVDDITRIKED